MIGAVEGGGTKFVCAVGTGPHDLIAEQRIETAGPVETLDAVVRFFAPHGIGALGVGMFGPLALSAEDRRLRGGTLRTPKPGWNHVPVRADLEDALGVPVAVDTDVNAAAMAEARLGAAVGADPVLYMTVGTGIGVGAYCAGGPIHGLLHPELGHIPIRRWISPRGEPDPFPGSCPFHHDCLEGMASGNAIAARTGTSAEDLDEDDPVWTPVSYYLGLGVATGVLAISPQRFVLGGGVLSQRPSLLARVRRQAEAFLGGYIDRPAVATGMDGYLVPPGLGGRSGLIGAILIGAELLA